MSTSHLHSTDERTQLWLERVAIAGMIFGVAFALMLLTFPVSFPLMIVIEIVAMERFGLVLPILGPLIVYALYLLVTSGIVAYLRYQGRLPISR